jgi:hypothetical protein
MTDGTIRNADPLVNFKEHLQVWITHTDRSRFASESRFADEDDWIDFEEFDVLHYSNAEVEFNPNGWGYLLITLDRPFVYTGGNIAIMTQRISRMVTIPHRDPNNSQTVTLPNLYNPLNNFRVTSGLQQYRSLFAQSEEGHYFIGPNPVATVEGIGVIRDWLPNTMFVFAEGAEVLIVDEGDETEPPFVAPALFVNSFPNPVRGSDHANFELKIKEGEVATLRIFNVRGQLVREFNDISSREQRIVWDRTDCNNRQVSSGIYFYKLSNENNSVINRMVILK